MTSFTSSPLNYPSGANTPIKRVRVNRPPTATDIKNFTPGDEWLDITGQDWYKFVSVYTGSAVWVRIGGVFGDISQLTGNSGGPVGPSFPSGNVNILGTAGQIDVVGNPSTNTLTISLTGGGTAVDSFTTNVAGPVSPNGSGAVLVNASTTTFTDGSVANTLKTEVQGTNHALFLGRGTNVAATNLAVASNGQIPIGSSGADPVLANITSTGGTINVTNGAGTINIETNNSGMNWTVITLNQNAADSQGYFCNKGSLLVLTLPATSAVGDTFEVIAMDAAGWQIAQAGGQSIQFGTSATTIGVGGSLTSTAIGDHLRLICNVANTHWFAVDCEGNITVV